MTLRFPHFESKHDDSVTVGSGALTGVEATQLSLVHRPVYEARLITVLIILHRDCLIAALQTAYMSAAILNLGLTCTCLLL